MKRSFYLFCHISTLSDKCIIYFDFVKYQIILIETIDKNSKKLTKEAFSFKLLTYLVPQTTRQS